MLGLDSLQSFDQWKQPEKILQLATPLVVRRPLGQPNHDDTSADNRSALQAADLAPLKPFLSEQDFSAVQNHAIQSRLIDISSSNIRSQVESAKSIRYLLPRSVEKYIESNKLYV